MKDILIVKRDGRKEALDLDKIHKVLFWATEGITGVSASEVEIKSHIKFFTGMTTVDIHETLIKSAADLISEETPNYQFVAGRLINYQLRKEVYGQYDPLPLLEIIKKNVESGFYDSELLELYDESEWNKMNSFIRHKKDEEYTFASMELWRTKYLVQNRVTGRKLETPQIAIMLIAATLFAKYPKEDRLTWVKEYYDAVSDGLISLPTPVMAGVRTPQKQFSSCTVIETGDSLDSINATTSAIVKYVSQRAGIGIGAGAIRAIKSPIRGGQAYHTGVIPFYRLFQSAVLSCSQGGVRKGSATLYCPIWHYEIEDILVLKNNKGTDDTRVRHIDYGIQFNKLFYERFINNEHITLFSPSEVPGLYDAFFEDQDKFKMLYEKYERSKVRKKKVKAVDLFTEFMKERKDTGRIYLMNVDHANSHSSFDETEYPIRQSNLCVSGNTEILIKVDGSGVKKVNIEELSYYMHENPMVFSYNIKKRKNEWKKITNFAQTSPNATVVRVYDKLTKTELICTPEHKVYTKSDGYVEAGKLKSDPQFVFIEKDKKCGAVSVEKLDKKIPVYDITVEDNNNFFANGMLIHNCAEITLPTKPLNDIHDEEGRISLCTLSAINFGKIKTPEDLQKPCELAVRGLDALLDYQDYPIKAAEIATNEFRPLGIGIINLAYWLAKNDLKYDDSALEKLNEFTEAWSYYLIKTSADLAKEFGPCELSSKTKYGKGILPIDTYKKSVDELVEPKYKMDWDSLRKQLKEYGIRNATLMACMPSETSSLISNATNGIEPVRSYVTQKISKDGVIKQVVPEYRRLKNKYDLLWDQTSPKGYIKIVAVLQKYIDQAISANTSYNPKFYDGEKISMKDMLTDILLCYKFGIKTLYYYNTNDLSGEVDVNDDDDCESCKL